VLARLSTRFPHLDTIARRLIRTWLEEQGREEEFDNRSQKPGGTV